ncbi:MAG: amidohydrolase, partial [Spirochaetota bacterium]
MAFAQPRILYGVPFYTMDGQGTVVECVVTAGGRILFSGSAEEAVRRFPRAEREELQLGCVVPGFVDAHIHLKAYSLVYRDIDLTGAADPGEALERVKKAASSKKEGEWIRGGGVEERLLRSLGRRELDEAAPQSPLVLFNADLRAALANTPALSLAGIDEHRRDPLGGSIERDPGGAPTGVLRERALELVRGAMPAQSGGEVDHAVERGIRSLLSRGITCVCDCSSNPGDSPVSSIMKLWHRDRLELRAVLMFGEQESSRLGVLGFPSRFGDERVRIGGCKLLADGSLASRTGLMSRPYRGEETTGMQLMGEDELYEAMRRLYTRYLWTAVHAVGDRANRTVLNAYERLRRDRGMPRLLMRVEHAQALQDEEVQRFASLGVFAVGNPALIPQDRAYAIRFLGTEAGLLHRFGSLMEAGARLAFGS